MHTRYPILLLTFSLLSLPLTAQAKRTAATTTPAGTHSFVLEDPALGMQAATVHVPEGWGFAGTVVHASNCVVDGHSAKLNTESRDGLTGIIMLPTLKGAGSTNPGLMAQYRQQGCSVVQSAHAADFVKQVVLPHLRPNARVVSIAEEPEFAQQAQQLRAQMAEVRRRVPPIQGGPIDSPPPFIETARVRIAFERDGHAEEEVVSAMTLCIVTNYHPPMNYSTVDCTATPVVAVRAPAGKLDALLANKPPFSIDTNPAWQQRINQIQQQQSQQQMQQSQAQSAAATARIQSQANANLAYINGAAARSQANADVINRQGAAVVQSARNSQAAIDHSAQATAASMGDTNTYRNGQTGTSYSGLSNQYSHTYDNGQGTILQTNSAYAPGSSAVWTELTPKY